MKSNTLLRVRLSL